MSWLLTTISFFYFYFSKNVPAKMLVSHLFMRFCYVSLTKLYTNDEFSGGNFSKFYFGNFMWGPTAKFSSSFLRWLKEFFKLIIRISTRTCKSCRCYYLNRHPTLLSILLWQAHPMRRHKWAQIVNFRDRTQPPWPFNPVLPSVGLGCFTPTTFLLLVQDSIYLDNA